MEIATLRSQCQKGGVFARHHNAEAISVRLGNAAKQQIEALNHEFPVYFEGQGSKQRILVESGNSKNMR